MSGAAEPRALTRKDFASDQTVRWCPGCGDYAILAQMQKTMPTLGVARENVVFISGIGCSSRFPYYMDTYGIHSIHGRAPTIATGLKCARPELQVWVVTGDGDALAIGGNHFQHALRRNIDINILLFNNRIYGLTKGQYSPTSELGKRTKSSPDGSIENPVNPIGVAIGSESSFIARTVDAFQKHMAEVLSRAAAHRGAALVEIAQNCVIFNDGAWTNLTAPDTKADHVLFLEHGKPMRFGKTDELGIRLDGVRPEVVRVDEVGEEALLVHDEQADEPTLAYLLSRMGPPEFPTPVGVFRAIDKPVYDDMLMAQVMAAMATHDAPDLDALYHQGETWAVAPTEAEREQLKACPCCTHANLPGASECEACLTSLVRVELTADETRTRIEASLYKDTVEVLEPVKPVTVSVDASIADAVAVMRAADRGWCLALDDDGKLVGYLGERNLLYWMAEVGEIDPATAKVSELMTPDPETFEPGYPLDHVLHRMWVGVIRHVPIVDDAGRPIGLVGSRLMIRHIAKLVLETAE